MRGSLTAIVAGVFISIASWVPLWIIEARDPHANPFALGLLTFAVSIVGGIVAFVGLVRLVINALRGARK